MDYDEAFRILADKNRMKIMQLLCGEQAYGLELAEKLKLSPNTISHHMSKLQNADWLFRPLRATGFITGQTKRRLMSSSVCFRKTSCEIILCSVRQRNQIIKNVIDFGFGIITVRFNFSRKVIKSRKLLFVFAGIAVSRRFSSRNGFKSGKMLSSY